jgi:hypothetical protein
MINYKKVLGIGISDYSILCDKLVPQLDQIEIKQSLVSYE